MDVKELLIDDNMTMLESMELLNETGSRVLFVADGGKLLATLTDGDIRRWILKNGSLNAQVCEVANYCPKYLKAAQRTSAKAFMKENCIDAVPIVDEAGNIESVVFSNEKRVNRKNALKLPVVIMAGGLGTRLYPYTKILPKPLIPIGEVPIVERIIDKFNNMGAENFFLIINHKKNMIKAYFNEKTLPYSVRYVEEDKPLGTGGGLSLLKEDIDGTFILSNCDIIIHEDYERIYRYHKKEGNIITMVCSLKTMKIPYGVIEMDEHGDISSMQEKPELKFFTNTGMYIVEPEAIRNLEVNERVNFPDIISSLRESGEKVGVYPIQEDQWLDMGQLDELEKMRRRLEVSEI